MTTGKSRPLHGLTLLEDSFGTPAAARGGMMTVAGASDDEETPPLLTDDEVNESNRVRIRLGVLRKFVHRIITGHQN